MRYLPLTQQERKEVLATCGVSSFEQLTEQVPQSLKLSRPLNIPSALSEEDLADHLAELAAKNSAKDCISFLGQGIYDHSWPRVIDQIMNRGEFLTAYTPYQPEISQGTLQMIFEYQSMLSSLMGMEVSNASLYDGPTSLVEGILMAARLQNKKSGTILVTEGTYDRYIHVVKSYLEPLGFSVKLWSADGKTFSSTAQSFDSNSTPSDLVTVVMQSPNKWGVIEDWNSLSSIAMGLKIKSVACVTHALSLGLFESPGQAGVDIVTGEAQALGVPVGFGGPHLGLICCKKQDVRQMPGRLVGLTVDQKGRRSFCVTLATREQHIRREKATSNICSNQNLIALRAALFMSLMGPTGLKKIGQISRNTAFGARGLIQKALKPSCGIETLNSDFLFNEICLVSKEGYSGKLKEFHKKCEEQKILAGVFVPPPEQSPYDLGLTLAFTERHKKTHIERLSKLLETLA